MKKTLLALALIFAAGVVHAEAVEGHSPLNGTSIASENKNWKGWYNNMLKGLKTKVQKKFQSKNRVSAVAAVRGAKQGEDPNALYWKGGVSQRAQKKLADEKKELTQAVELVVGGDVEAGRAALSKFLGGNPESFFAQDAKDALANLPAREAGPEEGKKEAPADEKTGVERSDTIQKKQEEKPAEKPALPAEQPGGSAR